MNYMKPLELTIDSYNTKCLPHKLVHNKSACEFFPFLILSFAYGSIILHNIIFYILLKHILTKCSFRLCLGPWSDHGEKTGGFYACNRYEAAKQEGAVSFYNLFINVNLLFL